MRLPAGALVLALVVPLASPAAAADDLVRHELRVRLFPDERRLEVEDIITLPADLAPPGGGAVSFALHEGLSPTSLSPDVTVVRGPSGGGDQAVEVFEAVLPPQTDSFTLRYGGVIDHPLQQVGEEYARGQMTTSGTISPDGVFLSSSSAWYPVLPGRLVSFSLEAALPEGWDAVSQGKRDAHLREKGLVKVRWETRRPQDDIYLVAGRYTEYLAEDGPFRAMVFLRDPDAALARRYLDATVQYVRMYSGLLGPYPYGKFAMVENFWETGYGMPSFTLLGPRVLRFPFILHSSYPHEILHNWWGNGVFIDYQSGNWGEGLTAYLSDHLIKEQRGEGAEHRQTTLQKYADYVLAERDSPLTEFRSRHGSVSEAIGYGKTLMLFHMLRRRLGDEAFSESLRRFYEENLFRTVAFGDLRQSFEKTSGQTLKPFFDQWVERPGAPELALEGVEAVEEDGGFRVTGVLAQLQEGDPFEVLVPLAVTVQGREEAVVSSVPASGRRTPFELKVPDRPVRVDGDPEFDVFRRLDSGEIPPALSRAFGAERPVILLPSSADEQTREMYLALAGSLSRTGPGAAQVASDADFRTLPPDRSVWILGWENRFLPDLIPLVRPYGASLEGEKVRLGLTETSRAGNSFVLTAAHPADPDLALLFVATDNPLAVAGLGRKLPHYHKYSYLAFEGDEPENVAKGRWPASGGPLTVVLERGEETPPRGALPSRTPLARLEPLFSAREMEKTVRVLSGGDLGGRGLGTAGIDEAARFIARRFEEFGLRPGGDGEGGWLQRWTHRDESTGEETDLHNVIAVVPGSRPEWEGQIVVVGAHYDGLGLGEGRWGADSRKGNEGKVHPGADDNASGVAVLLELARVLAGTSPERSLVFVAFTGEESGRLGSVRYLDSLGAEGVGGVRAMVNIDTVGRLEGGRILVFGGRSAPEWVHIFRGAGYLSGVEVEMAAEDLDASDQLGFLERGVPAVQVTSGPHPDYHRPSDTADKVDFRGLEKVASLVKEIVDYLSSREEPLGAGSSVPAAGGAGPGGPRKVSLGTVPDFTFGGPGVRLDGTLPDSPAERAGLRAGDVILRVGDRSLATLGDLSKALKARSAGDRVTLTVLRDGEEQTVEAVLEAR